MGQYHRIVNVDKRECISAYPLGCGAKQLEQIGAFRNAGTGPAALLYYLRAFPEVRGGGDITGGPNKGRWFGDRVAVIGDYAEAGDEPRFNAEALYRDATDITSDVVGEFAGAMGMHYVGEPDAWKRALTDDEYLATKATRHDRALTKAQIVRLRRYWRDEALGEIAQYDRLAALDATRDAA